jgi:hypothetical protein
MTSTRARRLSVAEMQAAIEAAWRGEFADTRAVQSDPPRGHAPRAGQPSASAARRRALGTRGQVGGGHRAAGACPLPGPTVLVLAAHAGAGASTVALLLGDTLAATGTATRLIECADPSRSGIAAATDTELGEDPSGWRRGRRGRLDIDRPSQPFTALDELPAPRPVVPPSTDPAATVVDVGWPAADVLTSDSWPTRLITTAVVVVVCRATVPGTRQVEQLLATLPKRVALLAALGPAKWPGVVNASCGSQIRALRAGGHVVAVPLDRHLDVTGLTANPLPKQLAHAGHEMADRLRPYLSDLTARQRRAG